MPENEIKLHDIKPLIEIQEYSFYYFLGAVFIGVVLVTLLGYLTYKWLKNRNRYNKRADHSQKLREIRFENPKKDAYDITFYGLTFRDDTPRHKKAYEALVHSLEVYKYKKDVPPFSDETKHLFDIYLGLIDV